MEKQKVYSSAQSRLEPAIKPDKCCLHSDLVLGLRCLWDVFSPTSEIQIGPKFSLNFSLQTLSQHGSQIHTCPPCHSPYTTWGPDQRTPASQKDLGSRAPHCSVYSSSTTSGLQGRQISTQDVLLRGQWRQSLKYTTARKAIPTTKGRNSSESFAYQLLVHRAEGEGKECAFFNGPSVHSCRVKKTPKTQCFLKLA